MGQVILHDDGELAGVYTAKTGVLDLPATPLHTQLHLIRRQVEQAAGSDTMNVVIAAFGLVHTAGNHWTTGSAVNLYYSRNPSQAGNVTVEEAVAAKYAKRATPEMGYQVVRQAQVQRASQVAAKFAVKQRKWSHRVLERAFCSGGRATHGTPAQIHVQVGADQMVIQSVHREDLGAGYEEHAARFKSLHSATQRDHNAMFDNHSEFHLALWLHQNFYGYLRSLPTTVGVPMKAKIYAITMDIVSTNSICRECATKLDGLLTPGYLKDISRAYFQEGYITSLRDNPEEGGYSPELRFLIRASAGRAYSSSPEPAEIMTGPIEVKSTYYNGISCTIHESRRVPQ